MKKLCVILLLLQPTLIFAQQYTRQEVREAADSILHNYLGDVLFDACKYTKKGYYTYTDATTEIHYAMLGKSRVTKGTLVNVFMSYKMDYDYPHCAGYSKIKGTINLELNNNLQSTGKPNLSFIPDFVFNGEDCRLLTKDQALNLAIEKGFKESKKAPKMNITYDQHIKQFMWTLSNRVHKDSTLQKKYVVQTMVINAGTKKVVTHTKAPKESKPQH